MQLLGEEKVKDLTEKYNHILSQLVIMMNDADKWIVRTKKLKVFNKYKRDVEVKVGKSVCYFRPFSPHPSPLAPSF